MRTIDADALIKMIVNTPSEVQNKDIPLTSQYDGAAFRQIEILGILEALPSAEPERKKGEWIYKKHDEETGIDYHRFCSVCGYPQAQICINFCACCGADMRGEEDG